MNLFFSFIPRMWLRALLLCFFSITGYSQTMDISGNVQDTSSRKPLQHAVAIAVRLNDSTLVRFTRTDTKGYFQLKSLPIDTYEVIISYPGFGDKTFLVAGSAENLHFDFGAMVLPPTDISLNEVVVYAYKTPIYFKGDTLVYVADSFKVKPNATVEDLLKKLPGIRVDQQGKITSQGQAVDQVLVDGDEFFGSDPTIATRNLNAGSVETVQLYEKKNESASGGDGNETIKVLDLKLKENAKKGYIGKVAGGSDFTKFYEGEALFNKFKKKQKISLFALGSNTPKTSFNWQDSYKFGLEPDYSFMDAEDMMVSTYAPAGGQRGIPKTLKTGFYYNDKLSKNTKIVTNYSFNIAETRTETETTTEYFLQDSSYTTKNTEEDVRSSQVHNFSLLIEQKLDSLTELEVKPRIKYSLDKTNASDFTSFYNNEGISSRVTDVENAKSGTVVSFENKARIQRKFRKKDRNLSIEHLFKQDENNSDGSLVSGEGVSYSLPSVNQQKTTNNVNRSQTVKLSYNEPITKKIKFNLGYDLTWQTSDRNAKSLDVDTAGEVTENPLYTNAFSNKRMTHFPSLKYTYEVKKYKLDAGTKYRYLEEESANRSTGQVLSQNTGAFLPFASFRYKFSDNVSAGIRYNTSVRQPEITHLQPVPDNSNPNKVREGNPELKPSFTNRFSFSFSSFRPISNRYFMVDARFSETRNAFANFTWFDSLGRTVSRPVNVNGNYSGSGTIEAGFPVKKQLLTLRPSAGYRFSSSPGFVNGLENITRNTTMNGGVYLSIESGKVSASVGSFLEYSDPYSSLNNLSNKPYTSQVFSGYFSLELPKKFNVSTDATYSITGKRADGYNLEYMLWNASLSRNFLKTENLVVSVNAYDILNQNINNERSVTDNQVVDTKNNVIRRYIMLHALFKFNNNKTKEEDEF